VPRLRVLPTLHLVGSSVASATAFRGAPPIADPTSEVSRLWIGRFSLVWFGFWLGSVVPLNLLIPDQLNSIDPVHKVRDFGIVNAAAGLAALVCLPVFGALCDRSRSRFGRRRAYMAGGLLAYAAALSLVGLASSWPAIAALWTLTILGASAATVGLTAAIADRVPDHQRGVVSGAVYGPQALGVVLGISVLTAAGLPRASNYFVLAAVLLLCSVSFIRHYAEASPESATSALSLPDLLQDLWISPREYPDFAWVFGGRTLVNLANSLGTTFLLYFLQDDLKVDHPAENLVLLTLVYLVFTLAATLVFGVSSDRSARRRIFVAAAAALQAAAGIVLSLFPSLQTAVVAAALLGTGYGAYMAVDQALITEVLPHATSKAKDLGIMNIGSVVPQALGPLLGSLIISELGGYATLFGLTGLVSAVGAASIYKVRSIR